MPVLKRLATEASAGVLETCVSRRPRERNEVRAGVSGLAVVYLFSIRGRPPNGKIPGREKGAGPGEM